NFTVLKNIVAEFNGVKVRRQSAAVPTERQPSAAPRPKPRRIMTKRKRTLLLVGGIVVLALGVGAFVRSLPRDLVLIGVVDANEIVVTPTVQARLDSLRVEEGSEVKVGQPI